MSYKHYKGKEKATDMNPEDSDSSTDSIIECVKQASLLEHLTRINGANTSYASLFDSADAIASSSINPVWIASDLDEDTSIIKSETPNCPGYFFKNYHELIIVKFLMKMS